ncbi:MAG: redoxin domain-containing protein [Bacteroidia bacterium]|nr:redoxin domain-containing protein [Bacteroidia bacterium]
MILHRQMTTQILHPLASAKAFASAAIFFLAAGLYAQNTPAKLQDFKFYDAAGKPFGKANLMPGQALLVFYFNPDCDHCQQQAKWIHEGLAKIKAQNAQMMWVSDAEMNDIVNFRKTYFPSNVGVPMFFVQDKDMKIDDWFGYSEVPTILVYDRSGNFVVKFKKETTVEELIKHIK